jgi:hypothetical protein
MKIKLEQSNGFSTQAIFNALDYRGQGMLDWESLLTFLVQTWPGDKKNKPDKRNF